ncbi:hypothetical protein AcW1_006617 [Taiwanofungus camphoratus]|nr:hypothetical protein AcV5_009205 [Antrodia cinnamomea]KAI0924504.1 hypothetical protein AcW2_005378 [Antrodia cinnamomea]KAI0954135.1 hypothetical protein AcV7_007452 [Antrodia cinnamomea]KAI0954845.1 hypothetical protein AcW1_006617 [Antrodia cinnamomea]
MPVELENTGSTTRDFQMLERNLLSHVRLAVLLSLLSSSLLLNARLPTSSTPSSAENANAKGNVVIAAIEIGAAMAAIGAGVWEYNRNYKDMRESRGFLVATKLHFVIMVVVSLIVFATCLVLVTDDAA